MFMAAFGYGGIKSHLLDLHGDPDSERGGVTGPVIKSSLEEILPATCSYGSYYAQDNAPTHKARIVQDWLRPWCTEHGITLVDWPPYSPDLNPIENLWKLLKERIIAKDPTLVTLPKNDSSKARLVRVATEVWDEMESDMLNHLIDTIDHRIEAVIAARGWYTKY